MKQELKDLSLQLRKARSPLASVMVFHVSEMTRIGRDQNRETSEDEAIQYVKKSVQKLHENVGSNPDEISHLEALLPTMASTEEIESFLSTLDRSNKGAVMKAVKQQFGALVDMKMVSSLL